MNIFISHRPRSSRLGICWVFCLILFISEGFCAHIVPQDNSDTSVGEVQQGLAKSSLLEASRINEELKSVDIVDAESEKKLRRVTETIGKSDKGNEAVKSEDITDSRDVVNDEIHVDKPVEKSLENSEERQVHRGEHKGLRRFIKRSIRRLKRDDQKVNDEKLETSEGFAQSVDSKSSELNDNAGQNKRVEIEGIRRLDIDVEEEDKRENLELSKIKVEPVISEDLRNIKHGEINLNTDDKSQNLDAKNIELGRSQDIQSDSKLVDSKLKDDTHSKDAIIAEMSNIDSVSNIESTMESVQPSTILSDTDPSLEGVARIVETPQEVSDLDTDLGIDSSRAAALSRLQILKAQAMELQGKIRNSTFLHNLREQVSEILPGLPKITESQFLEMLKNIITKKNLPQSSDANINVLKDSGLNDDQIEIMKCAQQLVAPKERQSFFANMAECVRGLNVVNCMRIFVYPIIVENMPEAIIQSLPKFPIEINVADIFQGNRDRLKFSRQVPLISLYANPVDPDAIIFDILMEGLLKNPQNENAQSSIEAKNETLSKLLSCNRLQLLQMTEKFLPENVRQSYSDEMLSCVTRFEYLSCMKYFAWPAIKQYYSALPQFPLSDTYLASLIYPNYPLITYPGFETGLTHLPEVIESAPTRMKPETLITQIFRKTLSDYARIVTPPTPIQLDLIVKSKLISQEQMASIHLAEQLLPVNVRVEYVARMMNCIRQFDYYNCMKYATWPAVRQWNPSIPEFPDFQELVNNYAPQIAQFFNFVSQFQLPQYEFPQFQLPDFPTLSLPDYPSFNPFPQQTPTISKPQVENPPEAVSEDSKKNDTLLESRIYTILKNFRGSMGATPLSAPTYTNRKVFLFPLMTEEQSKIFAIAESIVPPIARETLITSIYFCLNDRNVFSVCARTVIWPSIKTYVKGFPDFPTENDKFEIQQNIDKSTPILPMPGSADNFFIMREIEKFFSEGQENAMGYIIRSIQLSTPESYNMQKILDILRSIQFKTPDFLNMQIMRYPRTPEFSSILTENQENIVHAVESIIPEQIRPKFYNDMADCVQKNKFPVCSRNIIFPSIYPHFQKALFVPFYNIMPEKKNFSKMNAADLNTIHPVRIETKMNTEKQGDNIVTKTDRKFVPYYPLNPESVIFSMLRKVQISAESLPPFPKESFANTLEFKKAFSLNQAIILTVAEGILPEEYRKGLLEEMFKCNQKDSFLNCTRDIIFPQLAKAYPDFPAFPDFKSDINRAKMLEVIDSLNKPSLSSRAQNSKKMLPSIEILYQFISDDKRDVLRTLVDKLPDSLYYDLYLTMTQCTQYSDSISCGHDIIYPALRQYYDAPGFNIDNYYPISVQPPIYAGTINYHPRFDYEIFCENMEITCTLVPFGTRYTEGVLYKAPRTSDVSYLPFGKLPDGSRIFKRNQEIWNSNITPSVGEDKSRIPEYTGQSAAKLIDVIRESIHPFPIKLANNARNLPDITSKRIKRNIDDLLDSYPASTPVDKKNSVPRRIPSKSTFPNITETELLQILVHISLLKNEQKSENEDIAPNEYLVDSLNDTERSLITADQYEILKLVQGLNSETAKAGFMSKLFQCVRSLSFLRCVGIFVWPMIVSNLPSLPFTFPMNRDIRSAEEMQIQNVFGVSSSEFETELINRKEQIESNFIQWYKALTDNKFETNVGPLKLEGHGDGELAITFSGFREGRLSKLKDNKNLPSILTIISDVIEEVFDTKPNKTKNKHSRKNKRDRSLHNFEDSNIKQFLRNSNIEEDFEKSPKDDQVINTLLERLKPSVSDIKDEDIRRYFSLEDAYRAFQVLLGPSVTSKIADQLDDIDNLKSLDENVDDIKLVHEVKLIPLEIKEKTYSEKLKISLPKSRALYELDNENGGSNYFTKESIALEEPSKFKTYILEYLKKYLISNKRKLQSGLVIKLPKLDDDLTGRNMPSDLTNISRGLKTKMQQMMPVAGLAVSFVIQMALAHAKAAASVAGLLSNMALGSAMFGMVRDMVFGSNDQPNIKYVYGNEKYDAGSSWPSNNPQASMISFTPPPSNIHSAPSPHFSGLYQ